MRRIFVPLAAAVLCFALGVAVVRVASPARIVVSWETGSEVGTAGFLIYRGPAPNGPLDLLDETPILAEGDPLAGAAYRYEDHDVVWGRRYVYQLEEIEESGARNRYPEIVEARAGLGWPWAFAGGALLAILAVGLLLFLPGKEG